MRLAFVLFDWFPQGGLQQDLVKVVRACQSSAASQLKEGLICEIHCLAWQGDTLPDITTHIFQARRFSKVGLRKAFAAHVEQLKSRVDLVVGFNRLPGLDYYFGADTCFAHRAQQRSWWYRLAPRTQQYLRFEQAVFGDHSNTVAMLLTPQQRLQYQQHYDTPPHRLIDLPPGIDRKHCPGADAAELRASLRAGFGIADDELLVLQIGSSFITKGVERSLQALAALPRELHSRVHYCLMGRDNRLAHWQQRARDITGLGSRLHFPGPGHSVPRCMQGADVLLHPSLHESAGMVILEAVVAGLPVLTTASCGYARRVIDAGAGLVCDEPFNQQQLNAMLVTMLTGERASWRQHGIHYGQSHNLYDMPAVIADIVLNRRTG